jgi:molybdenum cofactor biosynthesis enzyme MoaA
VFCSNGAFNTDMSKSFRAGWANNFFKAVFCDTFQPVFVTAEGLFFPCIFFKKKVQYHKLGNMQQANLSFSKSQ